MLLYQYSVGRFGRIRNGVLGFELLTGDTFFYEPQTLILLYGNIHRIQIYQMGVYLQKLLPMLTSVG